MSLELQQLSNLLRRSRDTISMEGPKNGLMWVGKVLVFMMVTMGCCAIRGDGELQTGFYRNSCPKLQSIVWNGMRQAVQQEPRMASSILRLFFHDCLVQGCDASILLDDTPDFKSEKSANPNLNSARGFEVIDNIKADVENACPNTVSCADILALAARYAVSLSGGPNWDVPLGRRDATTAGFDEANEVIPSPFFDVNTLISNFQNHGLSMQDLVSLSGAHTFGKGRCVFFKDRLYNMTGDGKPDTTINKYYLRRLQDQCPQSGGDDSLSSLDPYTPTYFDNRYYVNLINGRGLFTSDQTLYSSMGSPTVQLVLNYTQYPRLFFANFASSMIKLSSLNPLTGSQGQIRGNCHFIK